jgi:hypothetical protein
MVGKTGLRSVASGLLEGDVSAQAIRCFSIRTANGATRISGIPPAQGTPESWPTGENGSPPPLQETCRNVRLQGWVGKKTAV